ncbi:MAG TPA: 4-coumarate--CoA ligase family protein [Actinomycetota bacterium]
MVHRSPYPDVEIPNVSLPAFVLERAADLGDKPALIDGPTGRTITYAQLAAGVRRAAAGLAARGLGRGDVVALFSPNVPEYAVAFHGVATAGGVNTTINSLATEQDVANQLHDSGARFVITVPPFLDRALPAADKVGIEEVFVFGEAEGATPFTELLEADASPPEVPIDPANDLVALPYSSGTTGLPKGVMLTHRNLVANICQTEVLQRVREDETLIGVLPFFHIYGMTVVMNLALYRGAAVVSMPRFDLEQFLGIMRDHRVTRAYLVPPIVLALAKHPAVDGYDLSGLEVIMSGAAPLDATLAEACAKRLGCNVIQGYGLTESSPVTHVNSDRPGEARSGSIGQILPSTEAVVVSWATGEELGPGEDGEICIRGPQVMRGYLNNPTATANAIDDKGWLHTGDIGHADEDGFFFIVDRLKELIKYKGYQVPPAELEAVLIAHPAVADAAVIPSPDEEGGEVPKAFVVLKGKATAEELMAFVAERVAPYKRIRKLEFIEEIPKSLSGKILRRVLVERERASA